MTTPLALITGGSRGLGRNSALHLARAGVDVVLTYRSSAEEAAAVVAEIEATGRRAAALQLDTGTTAGFPAFVTELRRTLADHFDRETIDHLVNNAGHGLHRPLAETTEPELDALVAVHLTGPLFLTQALLPLLADGGKVLFTSTGLARFTLAGGYGAYAAVKGAVEVLARYFALELGPRGIAVNTIAPGAIATDFSGGAVRDVPEVNAAVAGMTAMGRAGLPDDVGGAVAALLTGSTGWITGQRIEVSGGQRL
ncbi:SDR family NAD(P)-dependent oxidoreductase [Modestobacter roseus]|uniref:NAD(P)-dependent dehydrogenase (Short-subunit alcohol dehydrogenase family) n=1 Tax=Modestobacter roseus TaxID=1181884 RepID=A0A562IWL4_9ACTN|nr:SDR family oxidoreductase [Modestobacter roseus]MQA34903.1 SDR family oxidoreductase [Modestobacter roseus]TWH75213.1 NAD(P)-dependent dehydrogenase (short-subunit alcohol dehydrogenase family) [Modestobacter roseus]